MATSRSSVSRSILLVTDWFDARFQHGVARFAREHQWRLSLEAAYARQLPRGWKGDGCVAMLSSPETAGFVGKLGVPVVDSSHAWEGWRLPRVHEDDAAIGRVAAQFFLGRGYRQLVYFAFGDGPVGRARRDGLRAAAKAAGAGFHDLTPTAGVAQGSAQGPWLVAQLRAFTEPVGVLCVDDSVAAKVVETAKAQNLDIPGRVAVLGVGNLEIACECAWLPLSSIPVDPERIGYEAARLLEEILSGRHGPWPLAKPPVRLMPPGAVIERASTQGVAVRDPRLARLVTRLLGKPAEDLSLDAMARAAGVGRSRLYDLFAAEFRLTPAAFVERIRLRAACEKLADPARKLQAVARETGFGSSLRLHRAFARQMGMPPGAWRKARATGGACPPVPALLG